MAVRDVMDGDGDDDGDDDDDDDDNDDNVPVYSLHSTLLYDTSIRN